MKVYYPRCRVFLRINWEDFGQGTREDVHLVQDPPVMEAEVVGNDYAQADTFRIVLPYDWFPFDPRLIRACGVAIYMGGVDSPGKELPAGADQRQNLQLTGHVDDAVIDLGEDGKVTLEGRDFTGLMIDTPWQAFIEGKEGKENVRRPAGIDLRRPLDQVLRYILDKSKATKALKIEFRQTTPPTLGKWHALGEAEIGEDASTWDVIKHLVHQAGLICFVELDALVVMPAQALKEKGQIAGAFVLGENLVSLQLKRKLGRLRALNIRVRSYDPKHKRTLTGGFPKQPVEKITIGADGQKTKERQFQDFSVPNVADKAQLDKIAETIYTLRSRQQIEGQLRTEDLTSLVGGNELELTRLRSGSAITVEVDPEDRTQLRRLEPAQREKYLKARGYASKVAAVVARAFDELDTAFYTKAVTKRYSHTDGMTFSVDFVNFISGDKR